MKKKVLAMLLSATMAVAALAGCGSTGGDANGGGINHYHHY